jgi:hypothetical protein
MASAPQHRHLSGGAMKRDRLHEIAVETNQYRRQRLATNYATQLIRAADRKAQKQPKPPQPQAASVRPTKWRSLSDLRSLAARTFWLVNKK